MRIKLLAATLTLTLLSVLPSCKQEPSAGATTASNTPSTAQLPPGHPDTSAAAQIPAGHPDMAAAGTELPAPPSGSIDGKIVIADALKNKWKAGDAIFVMVRNVATDSLIAASKLTAGASFPLAFHIDGSNIMHAQTSLVGTVKLEARIDKDGDAITKKPGDLVGALAEPLSVPATGVTLTLDRVL